MNFLKKSLLEYFLKGGQNCEFFVKFYLMVISILFGSRSFFFFLKTSPFFSFRPPFTTVSLFTELISDF